MNNIPKLHTLYIICNCYNSCLYKTNYIYKIRIDILLVTIQIFTCPPTIKNIFIICYKKNKKDSHRCQYN